MESEEEDDEDDRFVYFAPADKVDSDVLSWRGTGGGGGGYFFASQQLWRRTVCAMAHP